MNIQNIEHKQVFLPSKSDQKHLNHQLKTELLGPFTPATRTSNHQLPISYTRMRIEKRRKWEKERYILFKKNCNRGHDKEGGKSREDNNG